MRDCIHCGHTTLLCHTCAKKKYEEPLQAELERFRHGAPIEGDYVCPDSLERGRYKTALEKIDAIRNDIVGTQSLGFSRHVYPLVAALDEAGFGGLGYEAAREHAKKNLDSDQILREELAHEEHLRVIEDLLDIVRTYSPGHTEAIKDAEELLGV